MLSPVKYTVNNRAWRHVQLNGVIQYNAPLKKIKLGMIGTYKLAKILSFITETTKDPYFPSLLNTVTSPLYM